jgi:hypothetical protein
MSKADSYYDSDVKAAIGVFKGFLSTDEFKKVAENLQKLRKENSSKRQLNNIEDMKVLTKDVREWLQSIWFPEALKTGLKYFAFVVPGDNVGKLSMKEANKNAQANPDIEIEYFSNEAEAKEWLKSKD